MVYSRDRKAQSGKRVSNDLLAMRLKRGQENPDLRRTVQRLVQLLARLLVQRSLRARGKDGSNSNNSNNNSHKIANRRRNRKSSPSRRSHLNIDNSLLLCNRLLIESSHRLHIFLH